MSYTLASSLQKPSLRNFPLHSRSEFKHTPISPFARNSTFSLKPLYPLRVRAVAASVRCYCAENDDVSNNRPKIQSTNLKVAKPIVHAVFCVVFGFFCSFCRTPVFAAPLPAFVRKLIPAEKKEKGHKYTGHTRRLLEVASRLLKIIEGGKNAGKVDMAANVEEGLKEVKETKKALEEEIMNDLYTELRGLKGEKEDLVARSEEIMEKVLESKREEDSLMRKTEGGDRVDKLREGRRILEKEYNDISERIEDIEDLIERKEKLAVSIGVTELFLIERECEALAKSFLREISGPKNAWTSVSPVAKLSKLSKDEFQKELQDAHRLFLEQIILSNVLVSGDKDSLCSQDSDSTAFALRIEQILRDSRKLQKNLEAQIRKTMRKHDEERHFIDSTLPYDVIKGYPDIELKWMFGKKEVTFPRGMINTLLHGWKKWREDVKMDLKRSFFEDSELGKNYMAERQERVLRDRDRVASRTWYNEQRKRWELDPVAVPYAVSRKLVESARIRHDLAAMYITLKGNDKEYYVDVNEFEMAFEEFGGFDALYLRLLAANIPTAVQLMWIPFPELNFRQQFLLILTLCHQCFSDFWNNTNVSIVKQWALKEFRNTNDDIMMIVFPVMESVIPYAWKLYLGMGPAFCYEPWGSTRYLKWKSEISLRSRGEDKNVVWYIWFLFRTAIYGYVVFHVIPFMIRFMKRRVPRALGLGPLRRDPNLRKLRRVKAYLKYRINIIKRKRRSGGFDPISTAFDHMKRIKNPPIPLKDFASVESMREEINDVVSFLQNPRAFQEMGARAPRGVLIVGEIGTGKTSLAMAIAAEAKVPLVEVKAQQLEAGLFVGQGASNVRELFQAARDLAPVIIFVEDFELFAGVRGKTLHTKKLDHESFINQLLVELDGFEKQDGVVLMATTRNLKKIDGALLRPGRMDRIFHLQRLTQAERRKILLLAAKESMDEELIDFVDWQKVAEKTALLRPIELKSVPLSLEGSAFRRKFVDTDELMSYCSWFATFSAVVPKWVRKTKTSKKISKMLVNHLGLTLTKEDVQYVVDFMEPYGQISNGIEMLSPPLDWSREAKFPHAVWAAGRGLMALILPNFDVVDSLWLEPSSWEGIGCTKITKARNEGSVKGNVETRAYLEKKLVFCFGSYVASQLLLPFGEENVLSTLELKEAQEIATRMVMHYAWGPDDSPTIYHHGKTDRALSMGDNFEHEMAAKVEKIYNFAYDKAKMLLQKNYLVLEKIVEELLEYEVLTGKDLERIVAENGGIREKEPFLLSYGSYEEVQF